MTLETKEKKEDQLPPRKTTSEKLKIVSEIESGKLTKEEAVEQYDLSESTLSKWLITFSHTDNLIVYKPKNNAHRRLVVQQILASELSITEAARQNRVSTDTIHNWLKNKNLSDKLPVKSGMKKGDPVSSDQVDFLKMKVASLEMMIDLAEETYKIDIRKKCGTKRQ